MIAVRSQGFQDSFSDSFAGFSGQFFSGRQNIFGTGRGRCGFRQLDSISFPFQSLGCWRTYQFLEDTILGRSCYNFVGVTVV